MSERLPVPDFFDQSKVETVFRVPYAKRSDDAKKWVQSHGVRPSATDSLKVALMVIDAQNTFCLPDFELFVGGRSGRGAVDDNTRLAQFMYQELENITTIFPTLDTHTSMQIFMPQYWIDENGNHPAPMTFITTEEVEQGKWRVNPGVAHSVAGGNYNYLQQQAIHYLRQLKDAGRYTHTIWPYHAMLGGIGHCLVATIEEACFFHAHCRSEQTSFEIKGGIPTSENFSILRPEALTDHLSRPIAQKNARFFDKLISYDVIAIAGQAGSHCVAWTIRDLLSEIAARDPQLAQKVYIMKDCTSAVFVPKAVTGLPDDIDFTTDMEKAFDEFQAAGMHLVKSTTPLADWDGVNL